MNFRTTLPVSVVIAVFMTLLESGGAYIVHFSVERHNRTVPIEEERNHFGCYCDGQTRNAKLEMYVLDKMFQSLQNRQFCAGEKSHQYCDWLDECQSCTGVLETCTAMSSPGKGYNCTKETFEMRENFLITLNGTFGKSGLKHRKPRQTTATTTTCLHPAELKTSSMSFLDYPSSVWAGQKCIFGHTLKEGISREMRCQHSENKWKPVGFEECLPFVDSSIKLLSPGWAKCWSPDFERAPTCNVTCYPFEDVFEGVGNGAHEFHIDGGWKPKMPFCVSAGTGMEVVPAPKIRLHPTENEPETEPPKAFPKVVKKEYKPFPMLQQAMNRF